MKSTLTLLTALLLAPLAAPHAADAPARRPNVLFIITDQQFAEAMSCRMGNQFLNTPALDRLAKEGTLFTRAYSANPICMPSRNCLFTGRYSHETGVTCNKVDPGIPMLRKDSAAAGITSMGAYFRDAGYDAAYVGKWHLAYKMNDAKAHGFDIITTPMADAARAARAVKFLGQPHERPFLLVVSFLNPHNICEWARRLAGRADKLNQGEIGGLPSLEDLPPLPANFAPQKNEPDGMTLMREAYQVDRGPFPVGKFTAEDWRKHRWGYYRMIEKVDAEIGKVLDALRRAGLADNTLIVFTSDHGECAGAHGWNQKTVFYDESARVPLIIAGQGGKAGATSDILVNTGVDILPTLLDYAGLAVPKVLPGRSLRPAAAGTPPADWRKYVVVQNIMDQAGEIGGFKPRMAGRMVRSEHYKYCIYSRGRQRESLVNLDSDPGEASNLAGDPQHHDALLEHREMLARFGNEHNDPLVAQLLADHVKPIPFSTGDSKAKASTKHSKSPGQ